jgi:histone-lysine N-methyltransferase ASH1L
MQSLSSKPLHLIKPKVGKAKQTGAFPLQRRDHIFLASGQQHSGLLYINQPDSMRSVVPFDVGTGINGGIPEETPSLTTSSTPPTSTEASSDTTDAPNVEEKTNSASRPTRARRSNLASYNVSVLSGTTKQNRRSIEGARRDISGETLVNEPTNGAEGDLLGDSIKVLDLDWSADVLSGSEPASKQQDPTDGLKRRRSTRQDLVNKVKDGLTSGISVLGKRGREAISKGKDDAGEAIHNLQKRTSLRPRISEKAKEAEQQPIIKKLRFADEKDDKRQSDPPVASEKVEILPKPKEKRWLSQGLYVGQDRIFDGRLTESQNRAKIAAKQIEQGKERTILPMPMFLGQKLLERGKDFKLPFDVFAPLPPGQPKPDEWKKCRRSKSPVTITR